MTPQKQNLAIRFVVTLALALFITACSGGDFKAGDEVDVEWKGSWWQASVISVEDGPKYKIHYTGWAKSWDETVGKNRIRAFTGKAQRGSGK